MHAQVILLHSDVCFEHERWLDSHPRENEEGENAEAVAANKRGRRQGNGTSEFPKVECAEELFGISIVGGEVDYDVTKNRSHSSGPVGDSVRGTTSKLTP
eukprot:1205920-Rhodomonas_salina.3